MLGDAALPKADVGWAPVADASAPPLRLAVVEPFLADSAILNPAELAGRVALVGRGGCAFFDKAARAAQCGAAAVLVINNDEAHPDATILMGGPADGGKATVPVMMVSHATGQLLLAAARGSAGAAQVTFVAR